VAELLITTKLPFIAAVNMQAGRASQLLAAFMDELQHMSELSLLCAMAEQLLLAPNSTENLFVPGKPRMVTLLETVLGNAAPLCIEQAQGHWLHAQHSVVCISNTCMQLTGQLHGILTTYAAFLMPKAKPPTSLNPEVLTRAVSGSFDAVLVHCDEEKGSKSSMHSKCDSSFHSDQTAQFITGASFPGSQANTIHVHLSSASYQGTGFVVICNADMAMYPSITSFTGCTCRKPWLTGRRT
jgi:hypothetical protein